MGAFLDRRGGWEKRHNKRRELAICLGEERKRKLDGGGLTAKKVRFWKSKKRGEDCRKIKKEKGIAERSKEGKQATKAEGKVSFKAVNPRAFLGHFRSFVDYFLFFGFL